MEIQDLKKCKHCHFWPLQEDRNQCIYSRLLQSENHQPVALLNHAEALEAIANVPFQEGAFIQRVLNGVY